MEHRKYIMTYEVCESGPSLLIPLLSFKFCAQKHEISTLICNEIIHLKVHFSITKTNTICVLLKTQHVPILVIKTKHLNHSIKNKKQTNKHQNYLTKIVE